MSKFKEAMRGLGIFNAHNFYGPDAVWIHFLGSDRRSPIGARWQVHRRKDGTDRMTDADAAWYDNKLKSFSAYGSRKEALAEAQRWAGERYGVESWARDPFGSYGPADYVDRRCKELKAELRERGLL